jgi:hypothetical protein
METAPLKSFATWARTTLIAEVSARLAVVLAPGSSERVENPNAVTDLERAIRVAGGGEGGRAAVAEKVAYTWFNRIIALRFMDANGFTGGVGVVSPERGKDSGQPEVLTDAKRGTFDADVVRPATVAAVGALLDGTRRSADPQGEAFALLLAEYCRHWHRAMPFMFEREGDYTELLIPSNLLADDSVISRAVGVLTEEVCADVEVIGWLYQFYISERKDEVFAGFKKNKKAGAAEIPAATQLFTPHWIVRYLVENSVGRLWLLNRPESRLAEQMDYYIAPVDEETDFLKIASPEELTVMDPACGSGHMLTYAFDLLYSIYEEEGYAPSEIPGLILEKNLFGVEIDPRAGALAAFALTMKARGRQRTFFSKGVEPNICVLEPISFTDEELDFLLTPGGDSAAEEEFWNQFEHADVFGSLIQPDAGVSAQLDHSLSTFEAGGDLLHAEALRMAREVSRQAGILASRYCVVVANPPYMGAKSMDGSLSTFARRRYRDSKSDLFAMFIARCLELALDRGMVGMITMQSWMFASSYSQLRTTLLSASAIRVMAHLGAGAFDTISGEVVTTTSFVLERTRMPFDRVGVFLDVTGPGSEAAKEAHLRLEVSRPACNSCVAMSSFSEIPGHPIAYWVSQEALAAFRAFPSLSSRVDLKAGISTGDNSTFERNWFEVSWSQISAVGRGGDIGTRRWTPCSSGGPFRRWYGNLDVVMDWQNDGRRIRSHAGSAIRNAPFMGRAGLTYSKVGGARFAVRFIPSGFVFDDTGRMIFAHNAAEVMALSAFLNSSTCQYFLDLMSPGLTYTSAEIGKIPWAPMSIERLGALAERVTGIAKVDWDSSELSWDFLRSPVLASRSNIGSPLSDVVQTHLESAVAFEAEAWSVEDEINSCVSTEYGLEGQLGSVVSDSLTSRSAHADSNYGSDWVWRSQMLSHAIRDLVSYALGCMFGRYSLDEFGLILANQGDTLAEYLAKVPNPSFTPDADNVIPIVDGDWFEDDIVARFREFLRVALGEEHFEENLRFVTESLGVKDLRAYFLKSFYADHVKRYKKRPIYWLFSSPKGSFNALIYMHRYTPSTVSTVLNEYLREYVGKLEASRQHHERLAAASDETPRARAAAQKEVDRLRKVLLELEEYEHDVLYPLATQQIAIDLDDGVKANYPKFGAALKKIPGLEARE